MPAQPPHVPASGAATGPPDRLPISLLRLASSGTIQSHQQSRATQWYSTKGLGPTPGPLQAATYDKLERRRIMALLRPPKRCFPPLGRRTLPSLIIATAIVCGMMLLYILLSLAPCLASSACYHGYTSPFSFDAALHSHASWMQEIPDSVNLTSLSIPGTHDTMTYAIGRNDLQCQNWNLSAQLDAGVRYFDIRARLRDDDLHIFHADGYTGFSYADVLVDMFAFLDAHPSEALVMRLKEEGPPVGKNNSRSFEDAFNAARLSDAATAPGAKKHLALYDRKGPIPTIGNLRSKIFLLQNFKASPAYGLAWEGDQMFLEDDWIVPDVAHLPDKWHSIRTYLEDVERDPPFVNNKLYLAHISAAVGVLPIVAAAGPKNRTQTGMNDLTGHWLEDHGQDADAVRTGVIIFDFPGKRAVDAVLAWNENLLKRLGYT